VLAADVKRNDKGNYSVFIHGGRIDTGIDAVEWIIKAVKNGAGEILLTSMDADGTKKGYDIDITGIISKSVNVPVIASGGCGSLQHFYDVFAKTGADAALAASLFHYGELTIGQVKNYLKEKNIPVRDNIKNI
jgi:cyclase